jgi:hypothetical protein
LDEAGAGFWGIGHLLPAVGVGSGRGGRGGGNGHGVVNRAVFRGYAARIIHGFEDAVRRTGDELAEIRARVLGLFIGLGVALQPID